MAFVRPRDAAAGMVHQIEPSRWTATSHFTRGATYVELLKLSVNTVQVDLKNIYAKLGVSSRAETVERARLLGLLGVL